VIAMQKMAAPDDPNNHYTYRIQQSAGFVGTGNSVALSLTNQWCRWPVGP
jgi:hypothetical protein